MQHTDKVNLNDGRERLEPAVPVAFVSPQSARWPEQEELEFQQRLDATLFAHQEAKRRLRFEGEQPK